RSPSKLHPFLSPSLALASRFLPLEVPPSGTSRQKTGPFASYFLRRYCNPVFRPSRPQTARCRAYLPARRLYRLCWLLPFRIITLRSRMTSPNPSIKHRRRKFLPRTFLQWLATFVVLLLLLVGISYLLMRATPSWYAPLDPTSDLV